MVVAFAAVVVVVVVVVVLVMLVVAVVMVELVVVNFEVCLVVGSSHFVLQIIFLISLKLRNQLFKIL